MSEYYPFVSVIVPFYNSRQTIIDCVRSLSELEYPREQFEVIFVDNRSTDGGVDLLRGYDVKILTESSVASSYAARNIGIQEARGELLAFTDSDCVVSRGWLRAISKWSHDRAYGCFAGEIEAFQPRSILEHFSDRYGILRQQNTLNSSYLPYPQTANAVYRREVFQKIGLFRPEMTTGGDADLAWRMQKQLELKVKLVADAVVYHHHRTGLMEFYRQFAKYERAKLFWASLYPDYPLPTVDQRKKELRHFVRQSVRSLPRNLHKLFMGEIDEVDLLSPFIKIVMAAGTLSARRSVDAQVSSQMEISLVNTPGTQSVPLAQHELFCPLCECEVERFLPFGTNPNQPPRPNALCPKCKSLERHRLIWLYFKNRTDLFQGGKRMLHVAPEQLISEYLRRIPSLDYLSADLYSPLAMVKMDLTDIRYPDHSFDIVYASHVLEHIPDDRKAMAEIFRVLKPGGWAILQVPINGKITIEDSSITDPKERERLFGQFDHVRQYGHDGVYKQRLESTGFLVRIDPYVRELGDETIRRYGLMASEDIYYCVRPTSPAGASS